MAFPIRISGLSRRLPRRRSRYVTFRSYLLSAGPPAANSSIRFAWIMLRVFYTVAHRWNQASLLATSLTPAAFATTRILREDSVVGLAIRRVRTPDMVNAPVMD